MNWKLCRSGQFQFQLQLQPEPVASGNQLTGICLQADVPHAPMVWRRSTGVAIVRRVELGPIDNRVPEGYFQSIRPVPGAQVLVVGEFCESPGTSLADKYYVKTKIIFAFVHFHPLCCRLPTNICCRSCIPSLCFPPKIAIRAYVNYPKAAHLALLCFETLCM